MHHPLPSGLDTASLYHASSTRAGPSGIGQRPFSEDFDGFEVPKIIKGSLLENRQKS